MKKKGLVYRMTMVVGLFIMGSQACGEGSYSFYFKNMRNKQLADEAKIKDFEEDEEAKDDIKPTNSLSQLNLLKQR